MPEYYDCCGSWVWPNDEPEVWEETWEPALWAAAKDFTSSGQCGPLYRRVIVFLFRFLYILNLSTSFSMYLFCNSRIHVITLYSGHICVYYASMLRCWHLVRILVRIDHPCLGVGCHTPCFGFWLPGSVSASFQSTSAFFHLQVLPHFLVEFCSLFMPKRIGLCQVVR
jgi:hypothetical protein